MPTLSLNQAAKEAGKSKATLLDAIRSGRLTAPKDEQGRYLIDPAYLFRAYPPPATEPDAETETDPAQPEHETALLRQKVEFLERSLEGAERERDEWRDQCKRMTHLLTDNRQAAPPTEPEPTAAPAAFLGAAPWFWAFLALAASGTTAWLWFSHFWH